MGAWREAVARGFAEPAAPRPGATVEPPTLVVVLPCFDEEEVLPTSIERMAELRHALIGEGAIRPDSTVLLVDDGSRDRTWAVIEAAARVFPWVHGLKLSRNRGHQNAVIAGMLAAEGDAVVTIDADLQDDPAALREMLAAFAGGAEVVYGIRGDRTSDSPFKRFTAEGYYRVLRFLGVDVVFNHADYRLMSRRAISALREFGEVNLFLRGIVPQLGFRTASAHYRRTERLAGRSKYPLRKMLALAWDGVTSFSVVPLRWITMFGVLVSFASFAMGIWAILVRYLDPASVPGWASTVVPIVFLGGVQLLSLGVIGEYVGKTYSETKRRPRFIVEKKV